MTKINVIDVVTDSATCSSLSDVDSDMASDVAADMASDVANDMAADVASYMAADVAANMADDVAFLKKIWPTCYWVLFETGPLRWAIFERITIPLRLTAIHKAHGKFRLFIK